MKRLLLALALLATPAFAADAPPTAKPVTLSATPEELQALDNLINDANKAGGLANAENAVYWHKKLVQAVADANKLVPDATLVPKP